MINTKNRGIMMDDKERKEIMKAVKETVSEPIIIFIIFAAFLIMLAVSTYFMYYEPRVIYTEDTIDLQERDTHCIEQGYEGYTSGVEGFSNVDDHCFIHHCDGLVLISYDIAKNQLLDKEMLECEDKPGEGVWLPIEFGGI
jgi:hypothetical protein